MERFWWNLGAHFNPTTSSLFYATQQWAISHAVGRVTCPVTGHVAADPLSNPHLKTTVELRPIL